MVDLVLQNKVVGIVFGSFDFLHAGHVSMLEICKQHCDWLIVGLQTDPTINRPLQKNKPIQTTFERYVQLKANKYVDEIITYDTENDLRNILSISKINKRFIGSEYFDTLIVGQDICELLKIEIVYINRIHNFSSRQLRTRTQSPMYQTIIQTPGTHLVDYARRAGNGLYLEFGVHAGGSITAIATNVENTVYGFDSFDGLPEAWNNLPAGHFACPLPEVPSNVVLIKGWFKDTLPSFVENHKNEKVAFLHIDCDLYSSTKCIFDNLKNNFQDGSIICFDELIDYNGDDWKNHEWKAWNEFLEETGYNWECLGKYGPHQVAFRIFK